MKVSSWNDLLPPNAHLHQPNLCLHQRDHPFQPFFCSIGHEADHAPRLLLCWGGIIGGDKHHYRVPQWVLHLNLHVVPWGVREGMGKGSSLCADLCFHARYLNVHFSESCTQVIFSCPPVLAEHQPLTGRTSGKEDWHRALAICYHPKYSLLSRMTQRVIRTNFRIVWIRWVSQLSRLGCGSLLDNTDPIPKNPKNSFLSSCPA